MKILLFLFLQQHFSLPSFPILQSQINKKIQQVSNSYKTKSRCLLKHQNQSNILKIWINFLTWRSSFMRRRFWLLFLSFNRFFNRFFPIFLFVRHLDQRDFQCFWFEFWKSPSCCRFWRIRSVWRSAREIFDERF